MITGRLTLAALLASGLAGQDKAHPIQPPAHLKITSTAWGLAVPRRDRTGQPSGSCALIAHQYRWAFGPRIVEPPADLRRVLRVANTDRVVIRPGLDTCYFELAQTAGLLLASGCKSIAIGEQRRDSRTIEWTVRAPDGKRRTKGPKTNAKLPPFRRKPR